MGEFHHDPQRGLPLPLLSRHVAQENVCVLGGLSDVVDEVGHGHIARWPRALRPCTISRRRWMRLIGGLQVGRKERRGLPAVAEQQNLRPSPGWSACSDQARAAVTGTAQWTVRDTPHPPLSKPRTMAVPLPPQARQPLMVSLGVFSLRRHRRVRRSPPGRR